MSIIFNFRGIGRTSNDYDYDLIMHELKTQPIVAYSNEAAGWYAIARDGYFMIEYTERDVRKYYKTKQSWAKRVVQLMKRGY
jgi:hypothetical protein